MLAAVLLLVALASLPSRSASAVPSLIQTNSSNNTGSASASLSYSPAATAGDLLVVVCSTNGAATISVPAGFSTAINESGDPAQAIFYKAATGGETSETCTFSTSGGSTIQIFEYSGVHAYSTYEASNAGGSTGTAATASTGNVTTVHANDLLIAAIISDGTVGPTGWSNSFSQRNSAGAGGKPANRIGYGSADLSVTSTGTYSTTASVNSGSAWRGQIAAFRALSASQTVTTDFVDGSGVSVSSPSAALSNTSVGFTCQTSTGSLGTATQKVRVTSTLDKATWNLTMAATSGPTATWYAPPAPPIPAHTYKFNDAAGSGCTNGQLTVNASAGTLTAQTNCSTTGITQGASAAFVGGTTDSVTILSSASPSNVDCYWELTGIGLSQKVPASQPGGSYTINMTMTATAI
jgi:hypothetical protein